METSEPEREQLTATFHFILPTSPLGSVKIRMTSIRNSYRGMHIRYFDNQCQTKGENQMIAIHNSRLFIVIALLACLLCVPYVIAGVLETLALVLGIVAAVVTIVGGILWVKGQIENALKNRKKSLAQLEADKKKLEGKIKESRKKDKAIQADIDDLEPEVQALNSSQYTAELAYTEADQVTKKAQAEVNKASKAYKASEKAYNDHIRTCTQYMSESGCYTESILAQHKDSDKRLLDTMNRRLEIAQTDEKEKAAAWKTEWEKFKKANRKLTKLERDKTKHVEAHGELLEEQKALNQQITAKEGSISEAEADLSTTQSAETAAPEYMKSFYAAQAAGEDMDQWVKDNPPPDSVKQFTNIVSKYSD